ncbi:hypothetical protein LR48_Vigan07g108100 [Vigna angularis]|uniref:Putative plant transposon protein domain-containing protein n=1 Tax=Phaseolus angularis TaxID=3914 RepID=A0A0L9UXS4_PHAAN|nr:hypothetical protein LR48_Vigan07g108100 [Vigna angularis]
MGKMRSEETYISTREKSSSCVVFGCCLLHEPHTALNAPRSPSPPLSPAPRCPPDAATTNLSRSPSSPLSPPPRSPPDAATTNLSRNPYNHRTDRHWNACAKDKDDVREQNLSNLGNVGDGSMARRKGKTGDGLMATKKGGNAGEGSKKEWETFGSKNESYQRETQVCWANIAVGKEFYTNARKIGDYPAEDYLGYVRGHAIRYDPDSINSFLGTVWTGEQCQFALCIEEGSDFDDVESVLCIPGGHFQRNRTGSVVNIRRNDLNRLAKYWMAFSHANIQPCSHVSDITLSRALLLYCAIRNLNVNIGQVIANEISVCANTTNSKAPLGHPSLITYLCKIAGVDTSTPPFERPRNAIGEAYYRQYCGGEEAAQPVPPRRTQREKGQA